MMSQQAPSKEKRVVVGWILHVTSYGGLFILGAILGLAIEIYVVHRSAFERGDPSDPIFQATLLETTLFSKDDSVRSDALKRYLDFLDERDSHGPPTFSSYHAADKALTLARLAAIDQRKGAITQGKALLEKATSYCSEMKWKVCTPETLTEGAGRLDRGFMGKTERSKQKE